MDHRSSTALAIICLAFGGAGCASKSARAHRDEIVMPMQTGSTLQRRVLIASDPGDVTEQPKKKKEPKRTAMKPSEPEKPKKSPQPKKSPPPDDERPAAPDRFR